jgi:hypothetical protein
MTFVNDCSRPRTSSSSLFNIAAFPVLWAMLASGFLALLAALTRARHRARSSDYASGFRELRGPQAHAFRGA